MTQFAICVRIGTVCRKREFYLSGQCHELCKCLVQAGSYTYHTSVEALVTGVFGITGGK